MRSPVPSASSARRGSTPANGLAANGWSLFAHPLLLDQIERLTGAVEGEKRKAASLGTISANAKLLAALYNLIFVQVPQDPAREIHRQGTTLGKAHTHWFRAKFGNGRFRLFFRFDLRAKIIVYAWVNDGTSLRTRGSRTDAYAVFADMLRSGNPPDAWAQLLEAARSGSEQLAEFRVPRTE